MIRATFAAGYLLAVAVWTWLLVEPKPVPDSFLHGQSWFDVAMLKFVLAKLLHFSMYTLLAATGGLLGRGRWPMILAVFLVLHGVGTEIAQTYVPGREGRVRDVLIDAAGVTVGTLALRWYRRRRQPG